MRAPPGSPAEALWRDELEVPPLSPRITEDRPQPWRQAEAWSVAQRVDHFDCGQANRLALADLDGGADALVLVTAGSPFARGFGVECSQSAFSTALDGVELDLIGLRLEAGSDTPRATEALVRLVEDRRLGSAALAIDLGYDPIGVVARTGGGWERQDLQSVLSGRQRLELATPPLLADGRTFHEAGASDAQELGSVLAAGVAYLRLLRDEGIDLDAARGLVAVLLAAGADFPATVAKFRAIRRLWARLEAVSGVTPQPLRVHAETSWRMMTRYDPWLNAMRAAAATAAAGLGGADVVSGLPMTLTIGLPDEHARRLARNTGRVLIDEAHLAKVDDPAAGAGGLEALTQALCEQAWSFMQAIEAEGGIEAALRAGTLRNRIAEAAAHRAADLATLKRGIVGTSRFPVLADTHAWHTLADAPPSVAKASGALAAGCRDAEPFEALRDRAEAAAAAGARPAVFLALVGDPLSYGPRANETRNLLAVAGIATDPIADQADLSRLVACFASSNRSVACLCGTEAAYAERAEDLILALRSAGAKSVLMASDDRTWLERGADRILFDGAPVLELLAGMLDVLIGA